jgi:hypothetical protein
MAKVSILSIDFLEVSPSRKMVSDRQKLHSEPSSTSWSLSAERGDLNGSLIRLLQSVSVALNFAVTP